ncbi:thiamine phosphate synthase [Flavobacterium rhizosphaerae]|uniref:Thiamine-phosphate synthase n=1 Tax=Flavobacterium rhizosphaerae TaxID=3163298 RepID=A0ABW8YU00_9FLAO
MNSIMQGFPYKLYLVIGEEYCHGRDLFWVAEEAVKGGVDLVQLREKHKSTAEFTLIAQKLKRLLDSYNIPLIINDNLNVAMAIGATGIHVGNSDTPPSEIKRLWPECQLLGYSIESVEQLDNREIQFADHLGISPVFSTPTKTDTITQWGIQGIGLIHSLTDKPLIAIGRMSASNAYDVINAGAHCIAVVSAICSAENPKQAAIEIKNEIMKAYAQKV